MQVCSAIIGQIAVVRLNPLCENHGDGDDGDNGKSCTGAGQSKGGDGTLGGDNEEAGFNIIPPSSNQPTNPTTPAANAFPSFSISLTCGSQSGQSKKLSAVF